MRAERAYMELLTGARSYKMAAGTLTFYDAEPATCRWSSPPPASSGQFRPRAPCKAGAFLQILWH